MPETQKCAACGAEVAGAALGGLCPACLIKAGSDTQAATNMMLRSRGSAPPAGDKPGGRSSSARFTPPDPKELAGHFPQFDILELIGQGGMEVVYKARQPHLDRLIALKILPPEAGRDPAFAERFTREARALAKLNHPNIVSVYDFGRAGEFFYFIMEYVDGVNLRQLEQTRRLAPEEALGLVPKICEALQYAHDEGVVHRDIKPGNILIDQKGRVKIADFGLAKLLGNESADFALTASQQVMGTPHYMAPEQVERPQQVDHRADIYSLGVVFYEMLTGELPLGRFAAPSQKVQVDVRLDEIVLRALEKEPERRYQHASEVKTQVETVARLVQHPESLRRLLGFEYRSKATWLGWPLLHMASGVDPVTGRRRVARGIVAFGDQARGMIAIGGVAMGGIAFGGLAFGVVAIGGFALGFVTFAAIGLALALGYGGLVMAPVALGGVAIGYYALGGRAFGVHAAGGNAADPAAEAFVSAWGRPWMFYVAMAVMLVFTLVSLLLPNYMQRRQERKNRKP